MKYFFLGKKELFKGLYIEDKTTWETYPVIHFDFSKEAFKDIGLRAYFFKMLDAHAKHYDIKLKESS